jgi:predicted homoserine dehydrogenase-like protein
VLVNIEADVTVGRILNRLARQAGVLYTVSSGDEPGCLMELWDFVSTLGYEPVVIGKGKNNPLDSSATPESVAESARRANKDPYQVASYVDGTKTMFEMTCAANATGCLPMQRGMCGPEATLETVSRVFALRRMAALPGSPAQSISFKAAPWRAGSSSP